MLVSTAGSANLLPRCNMATWRMSNGRISPTPRYHKTCAQNEEQNVSQTPFHSPGFDYLALCIIQQFVYLHNCHIDA